LIAFSDDVYLHGPPVRVAAAITAAPSLYKKVRLRVGWGPAKLDIALPPGVDAETLTLPRGEDGRILPHLVMGLEAYLGIPRHRRMYTDFISKAMEKHAAKHNRLLQLVRDIAEDEPLTALRLLNVCGVNGYEHGIAAVPPTIIRKFAEARDIAVVNNCLETIQGREVRRHSTNALPVGAGGASLHSPVMHGGGSHLGTYYRIAGPLIARLLAMGGCTPRKVAVHLLNP